MHMRNIKQRLVPVVAWRAGEEVTIFEPWGMWPNVSEEYKRHQSRERDLLDMIRHPHISNHKFGP